MVKTKIKTGATRFGFISEDKGGTLFRSGLTKAQARKSIKGEISKGAKIVSVTKVVKTKTGVKVTKAKRSMRISKFLN